MLEVIDMQLILQVYFVYGFLLVFFAYLGYKIISRKRSRLSWTCTLFYWIVGLAFVFNIIYRTIDDHEINIILNTLTYATGIFGLLFLLLFNQILLKSEKVFTAKKQITIILIWLILVAICFVFMMNGHVSFEYKDLTGNILGEYTLDQASEVPTERDRGVPTWTWQFSLYGLIITQLLYVWIVVTSVRLKRKMGESKYAKKYTYNITGCILFDFLPIGATLSNYLGEIMRTIYLLASVLVIPGAILIYKGLKSEKE